MVKLHTAGTYVPPKVETIRAGALMEMLGPAQGYAAEHATRPPVPEVDPGKK